MNGDRRHIRRRAGAFAALLAVCVACSPIERDYGYVPPEDQLQQIAVGRDTRDSVAEKIGRPLHEGVGETRAWYYVKSTQQTIGPRKPRVVARDIVAIRFDEAGAVQNVERFDVTDGQVIQLTARVTDSSVSELGLIRQIFGNVGVPQADQILEQQGQ